MEVMKFTIRNVAICYILAVVFCAYAAAQADPASGGAASRPGRTITLPMREGSLRAAVFGDAGRGSKDQYDLGALMAEYHAAFPFEIVLTTGDNIYGSDTSEAFRKKFELPYKTLLDRGVKFFASLGNHDSDEQKFYRPFNMNGREYYRIERGGVSFYALNSKNLDEAQIAWLKDELRKDTNPWRVAFFHHPPFSSGRRHGSDPKAQRLLHPIFAANGIDVVFNGHDHFYERLKRQDGIAYFVTGAAGKIRKGDIRADSPITAKGFDADLSFMLVEFAGDEMHFQVISKAGETVDSGVVVRRDQKAARNPNPAAKRALRGHPDAKLPVDGRKIWGFDDP